MWSARTSREHGVNRLAVGEIDLMPMGGAAGVTDRVDGVGRGLGPLEASQLTLDQRRCGSLAARRDALGEVALEAVAIGDEPLEVGIGRVGFGDEVEEMERAAARRQVDGDGRDDAAGRAGDHEHALGRERPFRAAVDRRLGRRGRRSSVARRRGRSRPSPGSWSVSAISCSAIVVASSPRPKSTDFTSASARSRA